MEVLGPFSGPMRWASNFHMEDGFCVEIPYQRAKTDRQDEQAWFDRPGLTPGQAKRLGRKVHLRPTWEQEKVPTMRALLQRKFAHSRLRALLLATGDARLVEFNNWHDTFWGVCTCGRCGPGANWLGRLLMEERDRIRTETAPPRILASLRTSGKSVVQSNRNA